LRGTLPGQGEQQNLASRVNTPMPPTIKENEALTTTPETASRPASAPAQNGDAFKQQPVALEVEVTVNGARTIEGSDKREPFSETTKTVLVFGNGAVIRLTSSVAPGQLLFLTNEKTKKEVVCQVVKSKNYRNVSGYVELEFTESVVGFWGMRFPSDRIGAGPQAVSPVAVRPSAVSGSPVLPRPGNIAPNLVPAKPVLPAPVAQIPARPKLEAPVEVKPTASVVPSSPVVTLPQTPVMPLTGLPIKSSVPAPSVAAVSQAQTIPEVKKDPAPEQPITPAAVTFDFPRASESQASILEPPRSTVSSSPSGMSFTPVPEVKPEAPAAVPPPVTSDPETEALKQHTARLQQQLSNMLFTEPVASVSSKPAVHDTPASLFVEKEGKEILHATVRISETAKAHEPELVPAKPAKPATVPAPHVPASLDEEELKIPAWLEPLARNATAPSSTQELILREKAKRVAEQTKTEEITEEPEATLAEQAVAEMRVPSFGDALPIDEVKSESDSPSRKSGKGFLVAAIAAGILIVAGAGWWYMNQQPGGAHASIAPVSKVQAPAVSAPAESLQSQPTGKSAGQTNLPVQTSSTEQSTSPAQINSAAPSNPAANPLSVARNGATAASARHSQPSSNPANGGSTAGTSAPAEVKKPVLGEVHLATPNVTQKRSAQNAADADPGLALGDEQPETNTEALNTGLVGGTKQPAAPEAPLAVGGDVKQAKLISPVPPVYPAMAKSQHVSGNVLVDALIDANGHVTTMKVVSGPALLHQAAMDALKQWKYQPATLDGKPTAMHLTVTIQFRLQ
jgi:TonB family protein